MVEIELETACPTILTSRYHDLDNEFRSNKSPETPTFSRVEREVNGTRVKIRYDFPASEMSAASRAVFESAFNRVIAPGKIVEVREV